MFRTVIMALLLSAGVCPALAQSQDPVAQLLANFDGVDGDGDGIVTRAEFRNVQVARWPEIDRNGDGYLTLDDFPRVAAGRAKTQLAEIAYLDADGDGRISQADFVNGQPPVFRRADHNGDGALTRPELAAAASSR